MSMKFMADRNNCRVLQPDSAVYHPTPYDVSINGKVNGSEKTAAVALFWTTAARVSLLYDWHRGELPDFTKKSIHTGILHNLCRGCSHGVPKLRQNFLQNRYAQRRVPYKEQCGFTR